eukprot:CAMPEP_0204575942 /NCGR_PEP_ID=MMETSP0661-20131031/41487_1 /ASSEMBLY_ACC=CAM_ASM_000606 /TAXON_ID=109239 /ORGANISM="Alexandrium margalefi, Strain AMGDE01CS-322" /LENGTH=53 /DNA_ID=CAMNT_0051584631 /DNA_START=96 /DNA_END=254 /DNA_ORIENTATION=-
MCWSWEPVDAGYKDRVETFATLRPFPSQASAAKGVGNIHNLPEPEAGGGGASR